MPLFNSLSLRDYFYCTFEFLLTIILQESKPVMYVSRALTETEKRYSNIERELLAIVFALKRLNHYTLGRTIIVQSDHQPL